MNIDHVLVRKALHSDAEGIARVHIASSEDSYAPLSLKWPTQDLSGNTERWATSLKTSIADATRVDFVATSQDQVVAFISGGPARLTEAPAELEIYVIHVLPGQRGRGIGGELWDLACTVLRGSSYRSLYLNTLAELKCCAFYEARGGEVLTQQAGTFHGGNVTERVYLWPSGKLHHGLERPSLAPLRLALATEAQ